MKFREAARNDDLVIRLKSIEKGIRSKLDVDVLVEECMKMLVARKYRTFDHTILTDATDKVADWAGEIATHRARLADIRTMTVNQRMRLKKMIESVRGHLGANYSEHFKGQQARIGDKKAIIDSALTKPLNTLADLDRLWEVTSVVYQELDDSSTSNVLIKNVLIERNKREHL
jgi:hypothetical protein